MVKPHSRSKETNMTLEWEDCLLSSIVAAAETRRIFGVQDP
jgi:hypothetical protein